MRIRCYLPPQQWRGSTVQISGREARHLVQVLRVIPGMQVTCFDGQGREAAALIERVTKKTVFLQMKTPTAVLPAHSFEISLACAIPQGRRFESIIDQATQMGVSAIIPLVTARSVVRVPAPRLSSKQDRWRQIALEAGKQSGVNRLPKIHSVTSWKSFVESFGGYDLVLQATVQEPREDLEKLLASAGTAQSILLVIGPEGDFTAQEIDQAVRAGAHRISLGPTVLRCETASLVATTLVSYLLRRNLHIFPLVPLTK